ncbi:hypothetical protein M409DRAFT_25688 [Zasmidium cellare ATCC 36951]|uniref:F-box domain-containing protein n=1 Tax=Zasmidium cellare ATCC 36951 TaxID=1080233 RepID=A0A6A6CA41_ZASCE|nr:uncharacterized protein M409DRAFT_25688 [Zasmidium cellare ATCC 36951]KAF2163911.1 hypothetical protein M409DRAFT_25688 [Zasmidium cellare ATCC 36951]
MVTPPDNDDGHDAGSQHAKGNKHFHFFRLPRELRDKVYAEAATDIWIEIHGLLRDHVDQIPCALIEHPSCVQFALVSRQFKQEYEEERARRSGVATLTVALGCADRLPDCLTPALRMALSQVKTVVLTHGYTTWKDFEFRPCGYGTALSRLEGLIPLLPSLKHLEFVFYESIRQFEMPARGGFYQPDEHRPGNIRRLLALNLRRPLASTIQISTSMVLYGQLFVAKKKSVSKGSLVGLDRLKINRVVYRAPASLRPSPTDLTVLEFDEVESSTVEDVEEYSQQRRALAKVPGHRARIWNAGYRMLFEP